MPERRNAVYRLVEHLHGGPWVWDGLRGQIADGQNITPDEHEQYVAVLDAAFENAIRSLNWERIVIAAYTRHGDQGHQDAAYLEGVCGECLMEALLSKEH